MKWTQILKYLCLFPICISVIYYFAIYKPSADKISKNLNQAQKQERTWEAHLEHAQMLSYLHQYTEAEQEYRKLLELKPDSILTKIDLSKILYYQGKYEEALNLLKQIPFDQRNEQAKLLIADIELSLTHYREAESLYQEYLQKFPEDQTIQLKLAEVLSWQKKYNQSIAIYQRLLSLNPDNVQIRRQYAIVLIWMGHYSEGADELKKTLATKKNDTLNNQ